MWTLLPNGGNAIFEGNLSERDMQTIIKDVKSKFWTDVLKYWSKISFKHPGSKYEILQQSIWYNSFIRINNKPVMYKKWFESGIRKIGDIMTENRFLSYAEFSQKFNIQTNILHFYGITHAIPREWIDQVVNTIDDNVGQKGSVYNSVISAEKPSQIVYRTLIKDVTENPNNLIEKWSNELQVDMDNDFLHNCFSEIYASSIMTKIRNFQFRLIHRIMGINSKLYKWGIVESNKCCLCQQEEETYIHLFWYCPKVVQFWKKIKDWIKLNSDTEINFSPAEILLGTPQEIEPVVDMVFTIGKMVIYYCKMNNSEPSFQYFIKRVNNTKSIEKYIAVKNECMSKYKKKCFFLDKEVQNDILEL